MATNAAPGKTFRDCFEHEGLGTGDDYSLLHDFDTAFAARSLTGAAALVIPVQQLPTGIAGRQTACFEVIVHQSLRFSHAGRSWSAPAVALVCNDVQLLEAFSILAEDVMRRASPTLDWWALIGVVDEWLSLFSSKLRQSPERELGLWGELWFLSRSYDVARTLAGWCGPEGDNTDFFVDGAAVEVKTSRVRHHHFVSHDQIHDPVGMWPAWLLSIWVKADHGEADRLTIPTLVDGILQGAPDKADALKRIMRSGYSPRERNTYNAAFTVLENPTWFSASSVPRVHLVDPGVRRLRYQVELDDELRADSVTTDQLWTHFLGKKSERQE